MSQIIGLNTADSDQVLKGWAASTVLHLVIVAAAVAVLPKMTLVIEQEPFRWDVALVEHLHEVIREEMPRPVAKVQPSKPAPVQPVRPEEPLPEPVIARVALQQSPQMTHSIIEPPKPHEPVQPIQEVAQVQSKPVEPEVVKPREVNEPEPVIKEEVVPREPVRDVAREATPIVETATPAHQHSVEHPTEPVAVASAPAVEAAIASAPSTIIAGGPVASPSTPSAHEPPPVVASALAPRATTRADYAWLAESLGRRIAALTRYPHSARMNGWEGRVVLRAIIRADGHLAEVTVQKSSGYEALDRAALETIRLACPLHMKHQLSTTEVAVNVPIVYSLAN